MPAPVIQPNEKDLAKHAHAINELGRGRSNSVGSVTLTINVASTAVTAPNCGAASTVLLFHETAAAATEAAAGTLRVLPANGSFTVTHDNSATAGRTFRWVAFG
jgi:phage baseplate assembly protein gpV